MTSTSSSSCATRHAALGNATSDGDITSAGLAIWVRQPWMVRVGRENLLIRGTTSRDLTAVVAMHQRCSARSLLERYRAGGAAPSSATMERALRRTLGFVACTARGDVVAMAVGAPDPAHDAGALEVGVLVQDDWQRRGVGRELLTHLSGGAYVCGYTQLISYTAVSTTPAHRLLTAVGRTYSVPDPQVPHLHTYLTESSALGLGAVREHMAS
jgi:GNAT superfamily N-acetyltransferase